MFPFNILMQSFNDRPKISSRVILYTRSTVQMHVQTILLLSHQSLLLSLQPGGLKNRVESSTRLRFSSAFTGPTFKSSCVQKSKISGFSATL